MMKPILLILFFTFFLAACAPIDVVRPGELSTSPASSSAPVLPTMEIVEPAENVQDNTFQLNNIDMVSPEDIIQEIAFFGGAGGGGTACFFSQETDVSFSSDSAITSAEIMSDIAIGICNIKTNETVKMKIIFPDGREKEYFSGQTYLDERTYLFLRETGNGMYELNTFFSLDFYEPLGSYRIIFSGFDWSLEYLVDLVEPDSAHLFLARNNDLILYKFLPNEKVRLFVYQPKSDCSLCYEMLGWKQFIVAENGSLIIQNSFSDDKYGYIAIGETTGRVVYTGGQYDDFRSVMDHRDVFCAQSLFPAGIVPLQYAEIIVDDIIATNGTKLKRGDYVYIREGPTCRENSFWWLVSRCPDNSCEAFEIPESGQGGYFLQPVNEPNIHLTPTMEIPACLGTLPTRLQVGVSAQVTTSGMAPQLSLRAQPSMSAEKVHVIAAGRKMVILEGPVCADESSWWRINVPELGFEGWVREGDNEDYWIDPLP